MMIMIYNVDLNHFDPDQKIQFIKENRKDHKDNIELREMKYVVTKTIYNCRRNDDCKLHSYTFYSYIGYHKTSRIKSGWVHKR